MTSKDAAGTTGWTALPTWVLRDSELSANAILVLLALASRVNKAGVCWPKHKTIAAEARRSVPTVKRALAELRDAGLIEWHTLRREDGGDSSNEYRLTLTHPVGHTEPPPSSDRPTPSLSVSDQELEPEELDPTEEQPSPPATPPDEPDALFPGPSFDDFWAAYPRKVGKGDAAKAWDKLPRGVDRSRVIAAASRYAADPNREDRYTKHPGPWLRDRRYEDETPLPARPVSSRPDRQAQVLLGEMAWAQGAPTPQEPPARFRAIEGGRTR